MSNVNWHVPELPIIKLLPLFKYWHVNAYLSPDHQKFYACHTHFLSFFCHPHIYQFGLLFVSLLV